MDAPPPVEKRIAADLARHGLLIAPAVVLVAGAIRGVDGAASAALGLAVCLLNFFAAALTLDWGARRSGNALFAVALGGFLFRMVSIVVVMVVAQALFGWVDIVVLGLTLFVTHLGLLFWELRSVSFSLAAPGLRRDRLAVTNRKGHAS
ncbi:MAG TPA: ATP synthase subunit I [Acidimicrobiia bacterium]|nr:ATP synthase subunit I [Acidimicrobiia bacterium]